MNDVARKPDGTNVDLVFISSCPFHTKLSQPSSKLTVIVYEEKKCRFFEKEKKVSLTERLTSVGSAVN
jgi:hypothetical protein